MYGLRRMKVAELEELLEGDIAINCNTEPRKKLKNLRFFIPLEN